ncbi:MAG: amidohydrolase family protein [Candidatus Methylacidiphilales bacterium]
MKIKTIYVAIAVLLFSKINAQTIPTVVINTTVHIGNGQVIENGIVAFSNGKIDYVGTENKTLYKNATIIDGKGKHVYPGIICLNNYVGLSEIEAVRATHDFNEQGSINPNVRSQIAYNTDSKILPTLKVNGIMFVQSVPQGGMISGTSSVMKTEGWNWEDATIKQDDAIHLNWPEYTHANEKQREQVNERIKQLHTFFSDALQYQANTNKVFNARLDAMKGLFNQTKKLYIHVNTAKGIINSIQFFKKNFPNIQLVLAEANEANMCIAFIKESKVPVVLSNIHSLPSTANKDVDQPFKTAVQLQKANILFAISHKESWQTRNLMFNAGTTVAYGLTQEEALQAITLNAAKIAGIDSTYGSIELGKSASLVISNGDILDMRTNVLTNAFINGEAVTLTNEQNELNQKYLKKYNLKD